MEIQQALVIFSGGQDSTTCLIQAIQIYGCENVQAITFQYGQRHAIELERARWIAQDLGVKADSTRFELDATDYTQCLDG